MSRLAVSMQHGGKKETLLAVIVAIDFFNQDKRSGNGNGTSLFHFCLLFILKSQKKNKKIVKCSFVTSIAPAHVFIYVPCQYDTMGWLGISYTRVYLIHEYMRMCMHRHAHVQYIVKSIYAYSAVLCDKVCILYHVLLYVLERKFNVIVSYNSYWMACHIIYMYFINVLYFMLYIWWDVNK